MGCHVPSSHLEFFHFRKRREWILGGQLAISAPRMQSSPPPRAHGGPMSRVKDDSRLQGEEGGDLVRDPRRLREGGNVGAEPRGTMRRRGRRCWHQQETVVPCEGRELGATRHGLESDAGSCSQAPRRPETRLAPSWEG